MVDVWSRKVVAWDMAEVESAEIAADLVQRACLKERYRRPRGCGAYPATIWLRGAPNRLTAPEGLC
ncbi:hypothetical protein H8F24_05870 [Synechococcus sp. CBW1002]|uniref:hypothetical protein n=1 Tax=Synechococcus sp. CBW1002 TaxID=1353134 RepID=UPI0018CF856D|nr:hypothetical protein [Synechococcus sp. CBW1002]QPN60878.1 hypothetical protein H8F24_05870 [Synechococcus sp. CBW1002]